MLGRLEALAHQGDDLSVSYQATREWLHMAGYQPTPKMQLVGENDGPLQIIIGTAPPVKVEE